MARSSKRARADEKARAGKQYAQGGGGHLGRAVVAALLLHVHLLVPLLVLVFYYAAREVAEKPEEVDVAFEAVPPEALPPDLPQFDETPPPGEPLKPLAEKPERPKKERERKPREPKPVAEKPPEPAAVAPPPEPAPPPPPQPVEPPKTHGKMVDLDNEKEVEPPPDAKFLAQKNNRAEVETRATQTNLEREQKGEEGSQRPNERSEGEQVGDDKAKVAELEDEKSRVGRKAPDVTPHEHPEVPEPETPARSSNMMALRQTTPHHHELTPETVDPSLPRDPTGAIALPRPASAAHDEEGGRKSHGKHLKLALSGKDYEYLFGKEAKAERQLAQKERSTRLGKHAARVARVRAALENFIPEVQPGNQTALNTRAAPFAAFIARMHRSIHKLWGFGVLEEWDELPSSSPLNDDTLMTKLEIVLAGDGTISKVTVVRPSRYLGFDSEAIDVVYNAGPYPDPPREIRSGNGKIYIHWSFHRDGRQCATSGVDYFILNNAPAEHDKAPPTDDGPAVADGPETAEAPPAAPAPAPAAPVVPPADRPRRLERNLPGGGGGPVGRPVARAPGARAGGEPAGAIGGAGPVAAAPPSTPAFAPLLAPAALRPSGAEAAAPPSRSAEPPPGSAGAAGQAAPRTPDAAAIDVASQWFAAYVRGDVTAMTARATFPFRSAAGIAAKSKEELARMLESLIGETPHRTAAPVNVETSAGLRKMLGKLPPGLDDGSGGLFAVSSVDGDPLILVLSRTPSGWKAAGLVRR